MNQSDDNLIEPTTAYFAGMTAAKISLIPDNPYPPRTLEHREFDCGVYDEQNDVDDGHPVQSAVLVVALIGLAFLAGTGLDDFILMINGG